MRLHAMELFRSSRESSKASQNRSIPYWGKTYNKIFCLQLKISSRGMCEDIFMYEGELFGYGVGIDAPREVAMRTCAREFNPSCIFTTATVGTYICVEIKMTCS